ncbi:MAG: phosphate ABC transporter permease subunit PstC [Alphaproteobacteria bacterium]
MSYLTTSAVLLGLVVLAFVLGRGRAPARDATWVKTASHASPGYYGAYVALWCGLPCLILLLAWIALAPTVIDTLIVGSLPEAMTAGKSSAELSLLKSQIQSLAAGLKFGEPDPALSDAAVRYNEFRQISRMALFVVVLSLGILTTLFARSHIRQHFRARVYVERITTGILITCSTVAVVTTIGIVVSLVFESSRFFAAVPVHEFLFGLNWEPQIPIREGQVAATGAFGAIPVFTGTLVVSVVAMVFSIPVGLMAAIYMSEYASKEFRKSTKPILEILAGIPTIVYGFFAVLTIAPWLTEMGAKLGIGVAPNSAIAAGFVMGIMITPFISSLSDDALTAVPNAMRDGAAALGATQAETIRQVLLPAALPGIMGGVLLAVSRAIGETMIVVMAAGIAANLTINPLEPVTTVTVQIVTLLIGDSSFDNPKTLAAFALGLLLFIITLGINIVALQITRKYREKYE